MDPSCNGQTRGCKRKNEEKQPNSQTNKIKTYKYIISKKKIEWNAIKFRRRGSLFQMNQTKKHRIKNKSKLKRKTAKTITLQQICT